MGKKTNTAQKQNQARGFAKSFAKKLNDAVFSKGAAELFMHRDHYKKVVDWHEDNRSKVTITVTSEGSKDQ
jgi:hypothetical protein